MRSRSKTVAACTHCASIARLDSCNFPQVMSTDAQGSIHSSTQQCKPEFVWQDFNRFFNGDCVSFGVRTAGDIDVALATLPKRAQGSLLMVRAPYGPCCTACAYAEWGR